jgi:hypothetical protein
MRQTLKERRKQLHRGLPMPRLLTMVLMLAIMAVIFTRLRDPSTWRWFSQDNDDDNQVVVQNGPAGGKTPLATSPAAPAHPTGPAPRQSAASPAAPDAGKSPPPKDSSAVDPEMIPTGPTDLDPMEQEDIKEAISIISDGNLEMTRLDMPAYYQILGWVDHQSTALLRKRAKKDVRYSDFRETPDSMRLQIVELKLNVRQIVRLTKPPKNGITEPMTTRDGQAIYEVRGFTQEGGSNLFFGIVTNLPKGMPIGTSINENAKLVGYFFKLQGYISLQQQLEAERTRRRPVTLKAPVILGRLIWVVSPSAAEEKPPLWLLGTIGSAATVVVVGWVLLATRRSRRRALPAVMPSAGLDPEAPSVDNWLDQAQSGGLPFERVPEATAQDGGFGGRLSGNIFWENDESNLGHGSNHGNGDLGSTAHDKQ